MRKSLFIFVLFAGIPTFAFGDQIFVCQSCTNPPGGDPNFITNPSSFNIGLAGAGHSTQTGLLVGPMHWLIQTAHVVIGFGALVLVQVMSIRDARLRSSAAIVPVPRAMAPRGVR